ncbi:MAG: hypothetical protein QM754_07650 [Tepidisphaeraceae bacterium]
MTDRIRSAWQRHGRVLLTLTDQGLVSVATFATNFLLLNHFRNDVSHYAAYTLAFNLMIWAAEFQATLVFTPHTIRSPRLHGQALRQFHGSTLLQNTAVSLITAIATLIASGITFSSDREMALVLLTLGLGTVFIGLRSYARPYCFTARHPMAAVALDLAVAVLQIAGILALKSTNTLSASTAIVVVAAAAALPSIYWLIATRRRFEPHAGAAWHDLRESWPQTKWVFLSGLTWNAGMLLYPWLIKLLGGDVGVAVWGACYQLACVANPLLMGLQNFIGPRIAEAVTEMTGHAFRRYVYRVAIWTAIVMTGPAVFVSLFADTALSWLTHGKFTGQHSAISFLCSAIIVQAITFTLSRGLFALHRADLDMYCNSLPLITLFTVGIAATHYHGVAGAAASMLIAQLLAASSRAILFAWAVRRAHPTTPDELPPTPQIVAEAAV